MQFHRLLWRNENISKQWIIRARKIYIDGKRTNDCHCFPLKNWLIWSCDSRTEHKLLYVFVCFEYMWFNSDLIYGEIRNRYNIGCFIAELSTNSLSQQVLWQYYVFVWYIFLCIDFVFSPWDCCNYIFTSLGLNVQWNWLKRLIAPAGCYLGDMLSLWVHLCSSISWKYKKTAFRRVKSCNNRYFFRGCNSVKLFLPPFFKWVYSKRKEFVSQGRKFFPFRIHPFLERA